MSAKPETANIRWNPETYRWDVRVGRKVVHNTPQLGDAQAWCKRNGLSSEARAITAK